MAQKDNILQELKELQSSLPDYPGNVYQVPAGYFEGLADTMISRIRALESRNAREEMEHLSPFLNSISRDMPYNVPAGYFEEIDTSFVSVDDKNELETLSPFLNRLGKELPYTVPSGYFDKLVNTPVEEQTNRPAKVVRFTSGNLFRYAAAAVITGIIVLAGYLYFNSSKERGERIMAKVTKDVKKMNEAEKENLMEFIDAGMSGDETVQNPAVNKSVIKQMLKDIPEEELKDFEEQTEDLQDVLMVN